MYTHTYICSRSPWKTPRCYDAHWYYIMYCLTRAKPIDMYTYVYLKIYSTIYICIQV